MQFLLNGLIAGSAYALVALPFALIHTPTRFFHFAHRVGRTGMRNEG
jgi:branched-subunit amino acid ABC-type transport system permease component